MVRFLSSKPAIEEQHHSYNQASSSPSKDSLVSNGDQTNLLLDVSFADSLLNFDVIKEFFDDSLEPDTISLEKVDIREFESILGMDCAVPSAETVDRSDIEQVVVKEEDVELLRVENLGGSIEEDMGRVSLVGNGNGELEIKEEEMETSGSVVVKSVEVVDGSVIGNDVDDVATNGGETDSDSEEESSSSSLSSSSSSSSEDDEEEEEEEGNDSADVKVDLELKVEEQVDGDEIEEGEIRDVDGNNVIGGSDDDDGDDEEEDDVTDEVNKMVEWSDVDEEGDGDVGVEKGPIRSKNELKALPPVPPVDAVLLPHHEMQPVGLVSSVLGTQVIVEGVEKHNPLNEGSIIWLTQKRAPLGLVDEIFGPVKNPFYIVRFNSENEVPEGLCEGTLVSFVPEFAGFVLANQNLYKKGYDASGENDEELSEEIEFSDDEKEAEYRRLRKIAKRGMNGQTTAGNQKRNKKKADQRRGDWKDRNNPSWQQALNDPDQQHPSANGNEHNGYSHSRTDPCQHHPANNGNERNGFSQARTDSGQQHHPNVGQHQQHPLNVGQHQQHPPNVGQHQQHPAIVNQQHHNASPGQSSVTCANGLPSAVMGQGNLNGGNSFVPPFRPMMQQQNPGFFPPGNGNWPNGPFPQHQQNPAAAQFGGFPAGNIQNPMQIQMQVQNLLQQLQQQLNPGQGSLPGQQNFFQGPPGFMPWPAPQAPPPGGGMMNQGCFNQPPFAMGFAPQPANPPMMNMGDQGTMAPGVQSSSMNTSGSAQSPQQSGNDVPPQNFNAGGGSSNRGRKPFNRRGGGGRFRGRGGR